MKQHLSSEMGIISAECIPKLVDRELEGQKPDLVRTSIILGIVEAALTAKSEQRWPGDIEVRIS